MKKASLLSLVFLIGLLLVIFRPFLKNQLINTDDGEFHAARSANYYLALKQGQLPVRWAPNLNNGYGYPVFLFNYHLPYLAVTALYAVANVPFQFGLNIVTVLAVISGGVGVWLIGKKHNLPPWARVMGAAIYVLSPYPLINVFLRGAVGEVVFMGMLPWVVFFVEEILTTKNTRWFIIRQLAFTGLLTLWLLTHPQSLLIAVPMIITYSLLLVRVKKIPIGRLADLVFPGTIAALLTMWFWIPALAEKQFIVLNTHDTLSGFTKEFPSLKQLFAPQLLNSDLFGVRKIVTLGYPILLVLVVTLLTHRQLKKIAPTTLFWISWFGVGLLLTLPISIPIWQAFPLLQFMQFPWRMLWLTTFAGTMLFIGSWQVLRSAKKLLIVATILHCVLLVFSVANHARYRGVQQWSDYELLEYFKPASSFNEDLPIWASKYTRQYPSEKISLRKPGTTYFVNEKAIPAAGAQITDLVWTGTTMSYTISTKESVEIIQKTDYFPVWKVLVDNQQTAINFEDQEFPGHIIFTVPTGEHHVIARFTNDTIDRKIADRLTLFGAAAATMYLLFVCYKKR